MGQDICIRKDEKPLGYDWECGHEELYVRVNMYYNGSLYIGLWQEQKECEEKLAKLILQMKSEIAALRNGTAAEYPDGVSPKKKQLAEYLRQHPGVSNKSYIARETGMDRTTVQKYYDEVRAELAAPAVS